MNLHFLASGSKANSTLVESRGDLLVIDAGLPVKSKTVPSFLGQLREVFPDVPGHRVGDIRAILVSHHHSDHAGRAGELSGALHVPIYATSACLEAAADKLMRKAEEPPIVFTPGERFVVGAFRILPVETYHVPGAVGFRVECFDGCAAIFTDLPDITQAIGEAMKGCGVLAIEADYDTGMLSASSYDDSLKQRIRLTHMANETLARYLSNGFDASGVHDIALLHGSRETNLPFVAEATIRKAVPPSVRVVAVADGNLPLTITV